VIIASQIIAGQLRGASEEKRVARPGDTLLIHCEVWYFDDSGARIDGGVFSDDEVVVTVGESDGVLMPALGRACLGLQLGESKTFHIDPTEDGHPQPKRDENLVVVLETGGADVNVGATVKIWYQGVARPACDSSGQVEVSGFS